VLKTVACSSRSAPFAEAAVAQCRFLVIDSAEQLTDDQPE
jgi:hypothetical protein